ncbi:hypothetical protein DERF_002871 [Dermatophagoides farinae]|uniref:Uncharacterized protein n=1 Tax=Dermatophagoides farinae TaxID=6954 RepID=A0A922ICG1_DERFA|nr:hypothetical protein DERF_002871 [Dermatophagoides farinae]
MEPGSKGQPKDINDECYTQTPTKIKPMEEKIILFDNCDCKFTISFACKVLTFKKKSTFIFSYNLPKKKKKQVKKNYEKKTE